MSAFDDDPAVCHCGKQGIGPHWHKPADVPGEVIGPLCPREPTPAKKPCAHGHRGHCPECWAVVCPCLKGRDCAFDANGVFVPPPARIGTGLHRFVEQLFHPRPARREEAGMSYWWGPPLTPDEENQTQTEEDAMDQDFDFDEDYDPPVTLDARDPFERVLVDIVETNRRKRRDYAEDGSPFSNFDYTADALGLDGFTAVESAVFNINQKIARLRSLRKNGRIDNTANESVADTYLDLAVYGVIALAISRYPDGKVA